MIDTSKLKRIIDDFDQERCQATNKFGQCRFKRIAGTQKCPLHQGGGPGGLEANAQKQLVNQYRLGKYQARLQEFSESDKVKSLRDEIGILRILTEEMINKCQSDNDIILYSPKIADLVSRLEKLVSSCHKIEKDAGKYLDQTQVILFGERILTIIQIVKSDEEKEIISNMIADLLEETNRPDFGKDTQMNDTPKMLVNNAPVKNINDFENLSRIEEEPDNDSE